MKEIENCQRLSMGPNFVVFLGQKYGYRPIPTYILSSELQLLRDELTALNVDGNLLDMWYKKDSNAVPPISVLQPISSILVNFNNKVRLCISFNVLLSVLLKITFQFVLVESAKATGRRSSRVVGHIKQNAENSTQSGCIAECSCKTRKRYDA